MIRDSNDETNFLHESLWTDRTLSRLRSTANIKSLKTQFSKIVQSGKFLGRLFQSLVKTCLSLMKNVIKPLAKSVLIPLGLMTAASAAGAKIHKKIEDWEWQH